jgi:trimeric autotransporter adhesin
VAPFCHSVSIKRSVQIAADYSTPMSAFGRDARVFRSEETVGFTMTKYLLGRAGAMIACMGLLAPHGVAQSIITTYAGNQVVVNGAQAITQNINPARVVADRAGGFYLSSWESIFHVAADGTITFVGGDGTPGFSGDGGPATSAHIMTAQGLALDGNGNLFVADSGNRRVRKITPAGIISTVAGNGTLGALGDNGPATEASLAFPAGVAVDEAGNLFIADAGGSRIRKVSPAGIITTVAGTLTSGFSGDGGFAIFAELRDPEDVAVDTAGNLFIADMRNHRIRKISANGIIATVAGNGDSSFSGDGGPATGASLSWPTGVAVDGEGNLSIADNFNSRVRKVTPGGIISTVAGNGSSGSVGDGGPATSARITNASGVAVDDDGSLFIADFNGSRIRKVTADGIISTVAGNGTSAGLNYPMGVAVDAAGNVFIGDTGSHRVAKVSLDGTIETVAGIGREGFSGDGGPATSAELDYPSAVATDSSGNLFIVDACNGLVRKVTSPYGIINTFGGNDWWFCEGYEVSGLAVDKDGNLFVSDIYNSRVRKVTPAGVVTTFVGGTFHRDGPLTFPMGLALDSAGNLYIAEYFGGIRKVTPDGIITAFAGGGTGNGLGDGGPATSAELAFPTGVAVDAAGNVFIADSYHDRIRKVTPDGIIHTVAGNGTVGFSGDGGLATAAAFHSVTGIAVDAVGDLFIADSGNNRIRKVTFVLPAPALTALSHEVVASGSAAELTLSGTNFALPLTINAGSDITVENIRLTGDTTARAKLTIAPNASLGPHPITVTTRFGTSNTATLTVAPPFPDLTITSSHTGKLAVGFNGVYTVDVRNIGTVPAPGPLTLTDTLPEGLTYVAGTGSGWSCSAAEQTVTCENPESLNTGASSSLILTVAVGATAAHRLTHKVLVAADGDLVASNNIASDVTDVLIPSPQFKFTPSVLAADQPATMGISLPEPFPYDVTGAVTLTFTPSLVIPVDDPAIQFASGGRQVTFVIPANSLNPRFNTNVLGPLAFQTGTVAGTFSFDGVLQAGTISIPFSSRLTIPRQAPVIQEIRTYKREAFLVGITLWSTSREVTQLRLQFNTTPPVSLSCGFVIGCTASGSSVTFDVKAMFDTWYATDDALGSLSTLILPLTIKGTVHGSVSVTLRNGEGVSVPISFPLP